MKKGDGDTPGSDGDEGERSNNTAIVKWANPDLHYLTSRLINMISLQHVLLQDDPSGKWAETDIKTPGIVIKNWINVLKKKYLELYNELGSTGHGLIEEDQEDEIWGDSAISNAWELMPQCGVDKTQKIFLWYKSLGPCSTPAQFLTGMQPPTVPAHWGQSDDDVNETDPGSEDEGLAEGVPGSPHLDEVPPHSPTVVVAPGPQNMKKNRQSLLDKELELVASQNAMISDVINKNNRVHKERKQMDVNIAVQMKKMEFEHEMVMMGRCMALEHNYAMECMESKNAMSQGTSLESSPGIQLFTDFTSDIALSLGSGALDYFPNTYPDYSIN
ncbi:hypothetical protein K439DRAFT_1621618 [Ramaria rubella]|nr:hypothetical protein K439DRAFT_1621618 [Ramaria rubella]